MIKVLKQVDANGVFYYAIHSHVGYYCYPLELGSYKVHQTEYV